MKTGFTLLACLAGIIQVNSQTLVTTSVLPRNAVVEIFNGINCTYCPDGDMRAVQLANAFPDRVVTIIYHTGPLADTLPGQPDYRTPFGASIDSLAASTGYPAGTMNRVVWPGTYSQPPYFPQNPPNNLAIRRQGWWDSAYPTQGAGANIILQGGNTPVNIGAACIFDSISNELTVNIELYYTSTETQNNKLNVALLENGVVGIQSTLAGYDSNYVHDKMLRHLLTGQWGDSILTTLQGTLVARTYTYIVPSNINIDNCEIAAFVTQNDNKHTHTGITLAAKNGTTVGLPDQQASSDLVIYPNPVVNELNIYGINEVVSELSIVDITGNVLFTIKDVQSNSMIDVSHLAPGFYFVKTVSPNGTSGTRFIKE